MQFIVQIIISDQGQKILIAGSLNGILKICSEEKGVGKSLQNLKVTLWDYLAKLVIFD